MSFYGYLRKEHTQYLGGRIVALMLAIALMASGFLGFMPSPANAADDNYMVVHCKTTDEDGDSPHIPSWIRAFELRYTNSVGQDVVEYPTSYDSDGRQVIRIFVNDDMLTKQFTLRAWNPGVHGAYTERIDTFRRGDYIFDCNVTTHGTVNVHVTDDEGDPAPAGVPMWFSYSSPSTNYNWPWNAWPEFGHQPPEAFTNGSGIITLYMEASYDYDNQFLGGYIYSYPYGAGQGYNGSTEQTRTARYEGGDMADVSAHAGRTWDVTVTVRPYGKLSARAIDADTGALIPGARFNKTALGSSEQDQWTKYMQYGGDGTYSFYAFDGKTFEITASAPDDPENDFLGYDTYSKQGTTRKWGNTQVDLPLVRHEPATIQGKVLINGQPAAGATVQLIWPQSYEAYGVLAYDDSEYEFPYKILKTVTTDANGDYKFTSVVPNGSKGSYTVMASKAGYTNASEEYINVSSGQAKTLPNLVLADDVESPTWTSGSELTGDAGRTGITLLWPAASDNVGIENYKIYLGETLIGTVDGKTRTYDITGLTPGTSYAFTIQAGDLAGNWSSAGLTATIMTRPQAGTSEVISRANVKSDGRQSSDSASFPQISENGRYVTYSSYASDLVDDYEGGYQQVYVYDTQTGAQEMVSVTLDGTPGNNYSYSPSISADGRYVAFKSNATNLVDGDANEASDIYVHDRQTGETKRVSVSSTGGEANGGSDDPFISGDGQFVAFISSASNLVSGDSNGYKDVFVRDIAAGTTERVNVSSSGAQSNSSYVYCPSISADGRFVAFQTNATNLVSNDGSYSDIFVRDRQAGTTTLVSKSSSGQNANSGSYDPIISSNGRYVVFESSASNLVANDTNGYSDIFVHDLDQSATERVSVSSDEIQADASSEYPYISADGRYVAFQSYARNLASTTSGYAWRSNIYVRDRVGGTTELISKSAAGVEGDDYSENASISGTGRYVAFQSDALNLVAGDTNGETDIFVFDREAETPGVDTTPPTVSATPTGGSFNHVVSVQLVGSEPGSIYYTTDGSTPTKSSNQYLGIPLNIVGTTTLKFMEVDTAGNESVVYTQQYIIDTTAPVVTIQAPSGPTSDNTPLLQYTVDDNNATVDVIRNGTPVATRSGESFATPLADGTYTIVVSATDEAGNTTNQTSTFTVDTQAPTFTDTVPTDGQTGVDVGATIEVNFGEDIALPYAPGSLSPDSLTSEVTPLNIEMRDANGALVNATNTTAGKVLRIDPVSNLSYETTYTVTVPGTAVSDLAGNPYPGLISFKFTTAKAASGGGGDTTAPTAPQSVKLNTNKNIIHIVWNPNKEGDLAGYNVYRSVKGGTAAPVKLNTSPIKEPQFKDRSATTGTTYIYYVIAVNTSGWESLRSNIVEAALAAVRGAIVISDIQSNAWYKDYVEKLLLKEVLDGYTDGTFRPNGKITRAEFAKMLVLAMGWEIKNPDKASFPDLPESSWAYKYIETGVANGVLHGYKEDGTFRPDRFISREEMAKIIAMTSSLPGADGTFKDIDTSWAKEFIKACTKAGIINGYPGDNTFKPKNHTTRAEAAAMIARMLKD